MRASLSRWGTRRAFRRARPGRIATGNCAGAGAHTARTSTPRQEEATCPTCMCNYMCMCMCMCMYSSPRGGHVSNTFALPVASKAFTSNTHWSTTLLYRSCFRADWLSLHDTCPTSRPHRHHISTTSLPHLYLISPTSPAVRRAACMAVAHLQVRATT